MFCHSTPQWNCKESQISYVSKEKLNHVCVRSGRALAGKEPRQMQAGVVSYSWKTSYRQRGHVGVGKWTWAGVNIDELSDISPVGLTDGTSSKSPPSRRDCLLGEDGARQMLNNFRCWSPSWEKEPWRTRGTALSALCSVRWVAVGTSLMLPCRHELCLAPGWAGLRKLLLGDMGTKVAAIPDGRCPAGVWLPTDSPYKRLIPLQMHTGMQSHAASNMSSALL